MKRLVFAGITLLASLMLITACRGDSKTDTTNATPSVPASAATSAPASTAAGPETLELESVWLPSSLHFEMENLIGQNVWALGYYGSPGISGDGAGFLVDNYLSLLADERLSAEDFARLDGNLPPTSQNGAEILVYGKVKDYASNHSVYTLAPTALVSVENYVIVNPARSGKSWDWPYALMAAFFNDIEWNIARNEGTQASGSDRALVLSGGIDASNNHSRYRDNVIAKYKKLKELGFSNAQIDILCADGAAIDVDGSNITDSGASKAAFKAALEKYALEMPASSTLTIFVTDHGTGYNAGQGYEGARPAFSGAEADSGKQYDENTFSADARKKVYRSTTYTSPGGTVWMFHIDRESNQLRLYQRVDGKWEQRATDSDGDGFITETEADIDIDGNGTKNDVGLGLAHLGAEQHADNTWDSDADGTGDVRLRWDGTRYVFERLKDGAWKEMGRDSNGDFIVGGADGGVDWNLDGDRNDRIAFHEGINLWGNEVLWDDEWNTLLKPLSDKGIHIIVEMVQCFGGGFIENSKDTVEKIVTGSSEDTKHYNRVDASGKIFAADEMAFLENLKGIDIESWDTAFDRAKEADRQEWIGEGSDPADENIYQMWEKPVVASSSTFAFEDGEYDLILRLPENLNGKIYDMEIITGLQQQRWTSASVRELPEGFEYESIPGGIRIYSASPFSTMPLLFRLRGADGGNSLRVQLTDENHRPVGYIIPSPTDQLPPTEDIMTASLEATASVEPGTYIGTLTADLLAEDLTGGKYPIVHAVLTANGEVWYDSGTVNLDRLQKKVVKEVGAGHIYLLELTATNSNGQVIKRSLSINIPETPPATTEQPPPSTSVLPPTENWVQQGVLHISIAASAQSTRDESGMRSQVSISYGAEISGDIDISITGVIIKINGEVWGDSGAINTKNYYNNVGRQTACGIKLNIEVIVTTSDGQVNIATAQLTTPVPPEL